MRGNKNMQLLVILALLLYGGKSDARGLIEEVKPIIEEIGGEDLKSALKSAEELAGVLSAVSAVVPAKPANNAPQREPVPDKDDFFRLSPINKIADENIGFALNNYFAAN